MNHGPLLHVLAQASEEADAAYSSKKPPKGKPWPRDRYLREIKRIRPANVVLAGPDFVGVTACLQELSGLGYAVTHREAEQVSARVFDLARFRALQQAWQRCCVASGTTVTDTSPWAYYYKHALMLPPEQRANCLAELAALRLPDLTVLLTCSGREVGRRGSPLSGTPVDTVALSALTHMRELSLLPGPQLTVDTTLAPPDVVASKVDAAIRRKLFRVLSAHVAEAAI